jgi:hypothetical protein
MMTPSAICLPGIPWNAQSSYMQGPSLAPADIRRAFDCDAANKWTESGIDLGQAGIWWNTISGRTRPDKPPWWLPNS